VKWPTERICPRASSQRYEMTIMPPRSGDATPDGAETAAAETAEEAAVAARRLGCLFVGHGALRTAV